MKKTLGIITIGQSPRTDLTSDIGTLISGSLEVTEIGLLDGFSYEEAERSFGPVGDEPVLVSRMRDGRGIMLSDGKMQARMQEVVSKEKNNLDIILILCTAPFPHLRSSVPLVIPQRIIQGIVGALSNKTVVGVLIPEKKQLNDCIVRWKHNKITILPAALSPYNPHREDWPHVLSIFREREDIDYIVLDCMGYSKEMKNCVQEYTGKKVILPRTMIIRIINDLVE